MEEESSINEGLDNDANQVRAIDMARQSGISGQSTTGAETMPPPTSNSSFVPSSPVLTDTLDETLPPSLSGDIALDTQTSNCSFVPASPVLTETFDETVAPFLSGNLAIDSHTSYRSFVPASPEFTGTYEETVDQLFSGDIAIDSGSEGLQYDHQASKTIDLDSEDKIFHILELSPNWAYTGKETKIKVRGNFLKGGEKAHQYKWSCMFGKKEVPAEVLAVDTLCCITLPHEPCRVPFYVTRSNGSAGSEFQFFEFRVIDYHQWRLEKFLTPSSASKHTTTDNICSRMEDDVRRGVMDPLRRRLFPWLIGNVREDGEGANVLDEEGQGLLHLAAAIGYDWIIKLSLVAKLDINFPDVNGWTPLHWAAFCGREETVQLLVALGASPGALTHSSIDFPLGRTPVDLAAENKHQGISNFLRIALGS